MVFAGGGGGFLAQAPTPLRQKKKISHQPLFRAHFVRSIDEDPPPPSPRILEHSLSTPLYLNARKPFFVEE